MKAFQKVNMKKYTLPVLIWLLFEGIAAALAVTKQNGTECILCDECAKVCPVDAIKSEV